MYKILGISSPIPHKWSVVLIAYSTIDAKQRLQLKNFYLIFFFLVSRMQLQNAFKNSCILLIAKVSNGLSRDFFPWNIKKTCQMVNKFTFVITHSW